MLRLDILNITKAVTKHLPVSKTCQHVPTLSPTSASCNQNPSSNEVNFTIVTRSRASEIDWTYCIFCIHKAFKHDRKMHKVSSENRTQIIKPVAEQISDSEMIFRVTSEDFAENAFYHSACIARYLLRNIKTEIEEPPMSEHENAFDQFVSTIQEDLLILRRNIGSCVSLLIY